MCGCTSVVMIVSFVRQTPANPTFWGLSTLFRNVNLIAEYARWWAPMVEDIVIDKNKGKNKQSTDKSNQNSEVKVISCLSW